MMMVATFVLKMMMMIDNDMPSSFGQTPLSQQPHLTNKLLIKKYILLLYFSLNCNAEEEKQPPKIYQK